MGFIAVYDACVLYPAPVRDVLLEVAFADLVSAKWTTEIHSEWVRNLANDREDLTEEALWRHAEKMNRAIPDSLVEGYKPIIEGLELPDPDDRHVLAAAIRCNAQVIVTANIKDFPEKYLADFNIEPVHPDTFLINQFDLSPSRTIICLKNIRARLKKPPYTVEEHLGSLAKNGLTTFRLE